MIHFTEKQEQDLSNHKIVQDKVYALERSTNEEIYSIKRGIQSFFIPFPKVGLHKTYSFETNTEIMTGFVVVKKINKQTIQLNVNCNYNEDWYWTYQINHKKEVQQISSTNTLQKTLRRGKNTVLFRAYTQNTKKLIGFQKQIVRI
tara:strand:- start:121 stop:558 length:438 start_codon:yes stop_codon:yes gene_type:complete